jgi:hypothetical protein
MLSDHHIRADLKTNPLTSATKMPRQTSYNILGHPLNDSDRLHGIIIGSYFEKSKKGE